MTDSIEIAHGRTTVSVPRRLFTGDDAVLDEKAAADFVDLMTCRYPWLTGGSMEVVLNKARTEVLRQLDESTHGQAHARVLEAKGDLAGAIRHMKRWAEKEPGCPDVWYCLGRLYSAAGDKDACFKAMNRGRSLI